MVVRYILPILSIAVAGTALAGGFMESSTHSKVSKSPLVSVGYAHVSGDFSDNEAGDSLVFDQFDGYRVGVSVPLVGSWGIDFNYFSSMSTSKEVGASPDQDELTGSSQNIGFALSYDLPVSVTPNLDMAVKLIVEEGFLSHSNFFWSNAANGLGLTGTYHINDRYGVQLGTAYVVPQGMLTAYDSLLSWHASLVCKLS